GASLDLAGNLTISGEPLILQGQGDAAAAAPTNPSAVPEIQAVTVTTGGTFTLTFNGQTTGILSGGSATLAADIQAALLALPNVGGAGGTVSVTKSGSVYTVTFGG